MPDSDWWHALWPDPHAVIQSCNLPVNSIVLDVCCGDGYFTQALADNAEHVYGVDLDHELLEAAQKRNLTNCTWIQADAMHIFSVMPRSVDVIFLANTFHGIPDPAAMLIECASTLRSHGYLVIINWHKRPREETVVLGLPRGPKTELRMDPREVQDLAHAFTLCKICDVSPYHYAQVFMKKT